MKRLGAMLFVFAALQAGSAFAQFQPGMTQAQVHQAVQFAVDHETPWPRETGGGWAEQCLAHRSQLWPLPDTVADEDAVLLDPAATALAAVLRTQAARPAANLVIGSGTDNRN